MANEFKKYGVHPSKKLGQNFLIDQNISTKIVEQISDYNNRTVLEIGPGLGAITEKILDTNATKVIVVEYDKACLRYLYDLKNAYNNLSVIDCDALKLDESSLINAGENLTIISNLPYNISVVLLIKWLDKISLINCMVLMFQKEVAERILAKPGSKIYGIVSVLVQYMCDVEHCFDISPNVFYPPPKVTSAVVRIKPKEITDERIRVYQKIKELCNKVFNQRRKMLRNTLKDFFEFPEDALQQIGLHGQMRPEELTVENFEGLAKQLM